MMKCVKRILGFCLTFCLLFPCMPLWAALGDDIMVNGNFSFGTSSWGYDDTYGSVVADGTNQTAYIDLGEESPQGNGPHFSQICYGVRGGGTYTLSLRVKGDIACETDAQRGFHAYFELYKSVGQVDADLVRTRRAEGLCGSTAGRWVDYTAVIPTTEEIQTIKVYLFMQARGKVYFDDISLVLSEAPEAYTVKTSHLFHYTQKEIGKAEVLLNSFYQSTDDEAQAKADFLICDTITGALHSASVRKVPMEEGKITFTYSASVLAVKERRYTLTVVIYNKEGTEVKTVTQGLYWIDRPTRITAAADYVAEGKVINPVIGWTVDHYAAYPALKAAGINVVTIGQGKTKIYDAASGEYHAEQIAYLRDNFAALEENDMYAVMLLCGDMKNAASPENLENTKKIVELFKNETRIFAWFIEDEPFSDTVTDEKKELLEKAYIEIRKIDKIHPVYLGENRISNMDEAVKYCDILQPHIYLNSPSAVEARTRETVALAKASGTKPVYPLVKAYCLAGEEMPSGEQIRNFAYQAILGGAQGFGYYSIEYADANYAMYDRKAYLYSMTPESSHAVGRETQWPAVIQTGGEYRNVLVPMVRGKAAEISQSEDAAVKLWQYRDAYVLMPTITKGEAAYTLATDEVLTLRVGAAENCRECAAGYQITLPAWQPMVLERQNPVMRKDGTILSMLESGTVRVEAGKLGKDLDIYVQLRDKSGETIGIAKSAADTGYCDVPVDDAAKTMEAFFWEKGTIKPLWVKETITRP